MKPTYTTQAQVRAAFWADHGATVSRKRIRDYRGDGLMYTTDTCSAFVDYVDSLNRAGMISDALAQRVTLE